MNLLNLFGGLADATSPCYGQSDEHFFDSIADTFSTANLKGHNAGFLRPGAYLSIILANGDEEDDGANGFLADAGEYFTSLDQVTALVQGLKPDAGMVSVTFIDTGCSIPFSCRENQGNHVGKLVQATHGSFIHDPIQLTELLHAALLAGGTAAFRLSSSAYEVTEVDVNSVPVPASGWSYDPIDQEIVFAPANVPPAGAVVTVTYLPGCQ